MTPKSIRSRQIVFVALGLGVAAVAIVFALLAPLGDPTPRVVEALFFAAAGLTVLGIVAAYLVQQRLTEALAAVQNEEQALELIFQRSITSAGVSTAASWPSRCPS
jgi:hypothetical protein